MAKIKIERSIKTPGAAIEVLRTIALLVNRGHVSGEGWAIAEGEPEIAKARDPKLDDLTNKLYELVGSEDITDEDLREASEGLLPALYDALREAGHGSDEPEEPKKAPESPEPGQTSSESSQKPDQAPEVSQPETPQGGAPTSPEGPKDATPPVKFPWEK